ncbi:LPD1 domain-containing protein [Vreelandella rituensis]|uniref:Large polyvalent protein-associated domain-containing protein n=1 Tax=Vreelandella rituensis TaxID=2282306 RepID=A0A368UAR5_9GAMM|nr:LPD1 domain-containing protein [Halomonas rituensis]RCV93726.1 hypothetical protein DU506_00810 [Halomonas rituensis]
MAKRIGDEGMILPGAPKLMFDNAVKLGDGVHAHISQMLSTSLDIDEYDLAEQSSKDLTPEQQRSLEEWQKITSKSRMLPKLSFQELMDENLPLPFLATLKAVRDALPARPFIPDPRLIIQYTELIEAAADWETRKLEELRQFADLFRNDDGSMSEEAYRDMHLSLVLSFMINGGVYTLGKDPVVAERLFFEEDSPYGSMPLARRQRIYGGEPRAKLSAATSIIERFKEETSSTTLRTAQRNHIDLLNNQTPWEQRSQKKMVRNKLSDLDDLVRLSRFTTNRPFQEVIDDGKIHSSRRRRLFTGMKDVYALPDADDEPDSPVPLIDRGVYAAGALGLKPKSAEVGRDDPDNEEPAELPLGTPVDEDGNPYSQPRRPERLDLSSMVDDIDIDGEEDQSEEAALADFRFLIDDMGFRALQLGNYVPQKMRRFLTGEVYRAVHDQAEILDILPTQVALGNPLPDELNTGEIVEAQNYAHKSLGLAFGARGSGIKGAAHYEPGSHILAATRDKGAGSFLHESGHALDFSIASRICNLDEVKSQFDDKSIARVTGRKVGTGVITLSEAFAMFWTMATNKHVQRGHAMPTDQEVTQFASRLLKPEYNTPEYLDLIKGFSDVMRSIYAEEVSDDHLMREHASSLARDAQVNIRHLEELLIALIQSRDGTDDKEISKDDALSILVKEDLWPASNQDDDGLEFIASLTFANSSALNRIQKLLGTEIAKGIFQATRRDPHPTTVNAIIQPITDSVRAITWRAKLLLKAKDAPVWPSESGQRLLEEEREKHLKDHDGKVTKSFQFGWRSMQVAEYLRNVPTEDHEIVDTILWSIGYHDRLANDAEQSKKWELENPTPHDMESTVAVRPSPIVLMGTGTASANLFVELRCATTTTNKSADLAEATLGLHRALTSQDVQINENRLTLHPRLLHRLNQDINHRLAYLLDNGFYHEHALIESLGIEESLTDRIHPSIPSDKAAAALRDPDTLEALRQKIIDGDSLGEKVPYISSTWALAALLARTDLLREKVQPCLAEATPALQYAGLIEQLADCRDWLTNFRHITDDQSIAEQAATMDGYLAPYQALTDTPGDRLSELERERFQRELRSKFESKFQSLLRRARDFDSTQLVPAMEIYKQGRATNWIIDHLTEMSLYPGRDHPYYPSQDERMQRVLARPYQDGLRKLADVCQTYGNQFAYMEANERLHLLEDALGVTIDWTPERAKEMLLSNKFEAVHTNFSRPHDVVQHETPDQWWTRVLQTGSSRMHRSEMRGGEANTLALIRRDYRKDCVKDFPQYQVSRMARSSAVRDGRDLGLNGYMRKGSPKYWAEPVELFARSFETYGYDKLGKGPTYLVSVVEKDRQQRALDAIDTKLAKLTLQRDGGFSHYESDIYLRTPTDYSHNYPSGAQREQLPEVYAPLVKALKPALDMLYPESVALHERVMARKAAEAEAKAESQTNDATVAAIDATPEPEEAHLNHGQVEPLASHDTDISREATPTVELDADHQPERPTAAVDAPSPAEEPQEPEDQTDLPLALQSSLPGDPETNQDMKEQTVPTPENDTSANKVKPLPTQTSLGF